MATLPNELWAMCLRSQDPVRCRAVCKAWKTVVDELATAPQPDFGWYSSPWHWLRRGLKGCFRALREDPVMASAAATLHMWQIAVKDRDGLLGLTDDGFPRNPVSLWQLYPWSHMETYAETTHNFSLWKNMMLAVATGAAAFPSIRRNIAAVKEIVQKHDGKNPEAVAQEVLALETLRRVESEPGVFVTIPGTRPTKYAHAVALECCEWYRQRVWPGMPEGFKRRYGHPLVVAVCLAMTTWDQAIVYYSCIESK